MSATPIPVPAPTLQETLTDLATIDRDIHGAIEARAEHERCLRRCQAWRDWHAELDDLLDLRLKFMDRRDTAMRELMV